MFSGLNKRNRASGIIAAILGTAVFTSCVGGGSNNTIQPVQPDPTLPVHSQPLTEGAATSPPGSYPAFPGTGAALSVTRQASDAETTLMGDEFTEESGEGNAPGTSGPNTYVIAPGDNDDLAWAVYGIGGFSPDRPRDFQIDVSGVIAPGDNDDLPLSFWIGLSNYSSYSWEWSGPYTQPTSMELNSEVLRERYVSQTDSFFFVVLTESADIVASPENPQGISAVEIISTTTSAVDVDSPEYYPTVPHYPTDPSSGEGGSKAGSALDPATQYVTLNWTHITDSASAQNEASAYRVLRQRLGGNGSVTLLNIVGAPATSFIDPTDANPVLGEPVPGETYIYNIRAVNDSGVTRFSYAGQQRIPLFPPREFSATNGTFTNKVVLNWTKPEGATRYGVFRDNQANRIAVIGDVSSWTDTSVGDNAEHTYWVRARNIFATPSPFSSPAVGRVNAAPQAGLSIGNGQESGTWPHVVAFDAAASVDPDYDGSGNGIANYEWDFDGDGAFDDQTTGPLNSFEYDAMFGDFNATVRVTDADGATGIASVMIHVNDPPTAVLTAEPTSGFAPLEVFFNATGSTDQDDGIVDYEWDFDGNGEFNEAANGEDIWRGNPEPVFIYFNPQSYIPMVRVTDESGATDTDSVLIDIVN